ncbi:peptidoglycan-binding domain-containing protein [Vibrio sinaloensis]|nr:peptidoglycan-binding domain-containing protein [Vibrio sinaloensis]
MQGEAVLQLEHHLSVLLGQPSLKSNVYDSTLEEKKVKLFQRWQGLAVDGIAGKRTLERLESLIRENVPQLNQSKEAV